VILEILIEFDNPPPQLFGK